MENEITISRLSKELRMLIVAFLVTLSVGYFTGLNFINKTSTFQPSGIENNYLGNENDENAEIMQFKKPQKEILTIVHNHILSMSIIFFLIGFLLHFSSLNKKLKKFLIIEPFVSIILTFGGIYILWSGILWFKYIVMFSGIVLTLTFILSTIFILKDALFPFVNPKH